MRNMKLLAREQDLVAGEETLVKLRRCIGSRRSDQLFGERISDEHAEAESFDIRGMVALEIIDNREDARFARQQAGPDLGKPAAQWRRQPEARWQQPDAMWQIAQTGEAEAKCNRLGRAILRSIFCCEALLHAAVAQSL